MHTREQNAAFLLTFSLLKYNVIHCVVSRLFPVWRQMTLNYIQRLQTDFSFLTFRFFFLLLLLLYDSFQGEVAKCACVGSFYDKLTKYIAEKICKVMNKINVFRTRCAGMWCSLHSLINLCVCAKTKEREWMAWQRMQVVTLPPHMVSMAPGSWCENMLTQETKTEIKTAILMPSFHTAQRLLIYHALLCS